MWAVAETWQDWCGLALFAAIAALTAWHLWTAVRREIADDEDDGPGYEI